MLKIVKSHKIDAFLFGNRFIIALSLYSKCLLLFVFDEKVSVEKKQFLK